MCFKVCIWPKRICASLYNRYFVIPKCILHNHFHTLWSCLIISNNSKTFLYCFADRDEHQPSQPHRFRLQSAHVAIISNEECNTSITYRNTQDQNSKNPKQLVSDNVVCTGEIQEPRGQYGICEVGLINQIIEKPSCVQYQSINILIITSVCH